MHFWHQETGFFYRFCRLQQKYFRKKTRFRANHASKNKKKENALFSPPATPKEAKSQNSSPPSYRDRTTMQTKILLIKLTQLAQKKTQRCQIAPFLESAAIICRFTALAQSSNSKLLILLIFTSSTG